MALGNGSNLKALEFLADSTDSKELNLAVLGISNLDPYPCDPRCMNGKPKHAKKNEEGFKDVPTPMV